MKRLILIDGNAILHRAYHALPPLTAPDGTPTNAIYGFVSMLVKLIQDLSPTHIVVAFDRPEPTFRKEIYKDYQAHRPEMDEDLVTQVDKVKDIVSSLGISIYEKAGFEADDVIGTITSLVKKRKQEGISQIIIVTGDKDLMQLVDSSTYLYMPVKGLSQSQLVGKEEVKEKLGVTPDKVVDFKALTGDPSDNYPGVSGIGPKTAKTLIEQFGTVDDVYKSLKEKDARVKSLKPAVVDRLKDGKEAARVSKELAEVKRDVTLDFDVKKARIETFDTKNASKKLQALGFQSLVTRVENIGKEPKKEKKKKEIKAASSKKKADQIRLL